MGGSKGIRIVISLLAIGCGTVADDSATDTADYSDCDSYALGEDYYNLGVEDGGYCYEETDEVQQAAYEDCKGDDHCAECMVNSYNAGYLGAGC